MKTRGDEDQLSKERKIDLLLASSTIIWLPPRIMTVTALLLGQPSTMIILSLLVPKSDRHTREREKEEQRDERVRKEREKKVQQSNNNDNEMRSGESGAATLAKV
jgi:hypothetical protein